jgi:hypothetical protein
LAASSPNGGKLSVSLCDFHCATSATIYPFFELLLLDRRSFIGPIFIIWLSRRTLGWQFVNLSTLFSLFKAKFTALSNNVLFSFISAGVFDNKVASGKYFVWAVATKGQTKRKISVLFS